VGVAAATQPPASLGLIPAIIAAVASHAGGTLGALSKVMFNMYRFATSIVNHEPCFYI